ncbi:hypothetical protein, partial [Thiolapillus sp.]|uniref:hypothetical protein n=1 Tax=Thiolapillus sp. TaxID=2017437 RepID=UPI003AF910BD
TGWYGASDSAEIPIFVSWGYPGWYCRDKSTSLYLRRQQIHQILPNHNRPPQLLRNKSKRLGRNGIGLNESGHVGSMIP